MKFNFSLRYYTTGVLLIALVVLSGCRNDFVTSYYQYYNWLPKEFPQGAVKIDPAFVKSRIRSIRIYDQFTTVAMFDVLRFDKDVSRIVADLTVDKRFAREDERQAMVDLDKVDLEESRIFYLLADIRGVENDDLASDSQSNWFIALEGPSGKRQRADSVTSIKLSPEQKIFFGDLADSSKKAYRVEFSRKQFEQLNPEAVGDELIAYSIVFSSSGVEEQLDWVEINLESSAAKSHDCKDKDSSLDAPMLEVSRRE
jgi:hypothetical protein